MKRIVLLDTSYFNFYRLFATTKWWNFRRSRSEDFFEALDRQYIRNLAKLVKVVGVPHTEWFSIRDSDRNLLWRLDVYPEYKQHRTIGGYPNNTNEVFHHLASSTEGLFRETIKIDRLEADDIIAVMAKLFHELGREVVVISGDRDFLQLEHAEIVDACGEIKTVDDPRGFLRRKIIQGDPSDGIPPAKYPWTSPSTDPDDFIRNSILIDFDYIPRTQQDRIVTELARRCVVNLNEIPQNYNPKSIQLGLCCVNSCLAECKARKPILATIERLGISCLEDAIERNLLDLVKMIEWNHKNGLRVLRMSSDLIPHASNPRADNIDLSKFQPAFNRIGELAREFKQRLTFHPGQYNVIGSPNQQAFESTVLDLNYHAEILDRLGCDYDSVMVVHGGGVYSRSMKENIDEFVRGFERLSSRVQRRLAIENDERGYNVEDVLEIARRTGIPVVFDTHHHECYTKIHPDRRLGSPSGYIQEILATWKNKRPKFHVSEQGEGRIGCHSDFVETIPDYILEIPSKFFRKIDVMIEAKKNAKAIQRLYERYPKLDPRRVC